jgi:hypothetical protein
MIPRIRRRPLGWAPGLPDLPAYLCNQYYWREANSDQAEANVKRIVALLALVILAWLGPGPSARAEGPAVDGSSVTLINEGDQSLKFVLRPADGKWLTYSVDSGKTTMLACDHCKTPYFEFSMVTEGSQVSYRLIPLETYLLYWNQDKHRWDLSHQESSR